MLVLAMMLWYAPILLVNRHFLRGAFTFNDSCTSDILNRWTDLCTNHLIKKFPSSDSKKVLYLLNFMWNWFWCLWLVPVSISLKITISSYSFVLKALQEIQVSLLYLLKTAFFRWQVNRELQNKTRFLYLISDPFHPSHQYLQILVN